MVLGWFGRVWEGLGRVGRGGEGWGELGVTCGGGIFYTFFLGFAIDRSKKYIKVIKIYVKIDAVDPWAAADPPRSQWLGVCTPRLPPPAAEAGLL